MTATGTTSAQPILAWINEELPPLSWNIIAMKMMRQFLQHKIMPSQVNDHTELPDELVEDIRETIKSLYNQELPQY